MSLGDGQKQWVSWNNWGTAEIREIEFRVNYERVWENCELQRITEIETRPGNGGTEDIPKRDRNNIKSEGSIGYKLPTNLQKNGSKLYENGQIRNFALNFEQMSQFVVKPHWQRIIGNGINIRYVRKRLPINEQIQWSGTVLQKVYVDRIKHNVKVKYEICDIIV